MIREFEFAISSPRAFSRHEHVGDERFGRKAAYRFFSNDRVSEADILAGHFQSTRERTIGIDGQILVLHDTTEFSYQREDTNAIGITKSINRIDDLLPWNIGRAATQSVAA